MRTARLGRELLEGLGNPGADWVKLEVLADTRTLLPDPVATLEATRVLVKEGFQVLCYTSDDPIMARRLKEAGAASVMPAGSPIGSGQGVLNPNNIRIILEDLKGDDPDYPVIVDAGVGTASDVTIAMELGCDGVLLNTGHRRRRATRSAWPTPCAWRSRPAGSPPAPGGSRKKLYATAPARPRAWSGATDGRPSVPSPAWMPAHPDKDASDRMARLDPASILGPGGAVARRLPRYELRDRAAPDGRGRRPRHRAAGPPDRRGRHGRRQELRLPRPGDPGRRRAEARRSSSRRTRSPPGAVAPARTSRSCGR